MNRKSGRIVDLETVTLGPEDVGKVFSLVHQYDVHDFMSGDTSTITRALARQSFNYITLYPLNQRPEETNRLSLICAIDMPVFPAANGDRVLCYLVTSFEYNIFDTSKPYYSQIWQRPYYTQICKALKKAV